jgi:hypothetical protein
MCDAKGEDLGKGDSAKGVPEEEGADEQARDGFEQVAAGGGCGSGVHAGTWESEVRTVLRESDWCGRRYNMQLHCNFGTAAARLGEVLMVVREMED